MMTFPWLPWSIFQTPRSSFTFVASRGTNRWLVVFGSTTHRPIEKMAHNDAGKICEDVDKMWFATEDEFFWTENVVLFFGGVCFCFYLLIFTLENDPLWRLCVFLTPPTFRPTHYDYSRSGPFFRISNWDVWDSQQKSISSDTTCRVFNSLLRCTGRGLKTLNLWGFLIKTFALQQWKNQSLICSFNSINKWLNHLQTEIATCSQLLIEISGMIFAALCGLIYVIHRLGHFCRRRLYQNNHQAAVIGTAVLLMLLIMSLGWGNMTQTKTAGETTHPETNNLAPAKPWWLEDYSFPFGARCLFSGVKC